VTKNKNIKKKPFPTKRIGWMDIVTIGGPVQMGSHGKVLETFQRQAQWPRFTEDVMNEYTAATQGNGWIGHE